MNFTVLGASGFIGSNLVPWLQSQGFSCWTPRRGEDLLSRPLGHAICCIGLTADFRKRPYDTVRAHVCYLLDILEKAEFTSFLYLSTARIYKGAATTHEDAILNINPLLRGDLYNMSKIMGECLCLTSGRPNVRIARLSNVYGRDFLSENFLSRVIRDAVDNHKVVLETTMASEKDYVYIDDVVRLLAQIALSGRHRVYNVASGVNTTNEALIAEIQQVTGCTVEMAKGATTVVFPPICIDRILDEFAFTRSLLHSLLGNIVYEYQCEADTH